MKPTDATERARLDKLRKDYQHNEEMTAKKLYAVELATKKLYVIEQRHLRTVNTDPQRRCYNGCHAKSETIWSEWSWLEVYVPSSDVAERLAFWRGLNDYAIDQRGRGATKEFRGVPQAGYANYWGK